MDINLAPSGGDPPWLSGQSEQLGRYYLGPVLGRGGIGTVYEAWDPVLRRRVALKVIEQASPSVMLRFLQEAQAMAKVDHPNICRVFDVYAESGPPRIAMQLIQGKTLVEAAPVLGIREACRIFATLAEGVGALHEMNVIHRDLKPSNILLEPSEDGHWHPWVCDFGLAKDLESESITHSHAWVGTPAYMAPEQLLKPSSVGSATDIYGFGATLHAVLTGLPPSTLDWWPSDGPTPHPSPIRSLRKHGQLPEDLNIILARCLEIRPEDRYVSMRALRDDLHRFLDGSPIQARRVGWLGWTVRKCRAHPKFAISLASAFLLIGVAFAWAGRVALRSREQAQLAARFGQATKNIEYTMALERLLPPHDLRPALASVRSEMALLRTDLERLGSVAEGPGRYALGKAHLALGEPTVAVTELERAWNAGYQTPESGRALVRALAGSWYEKHRGWANIETRRIWESERETLAGRAEHYLKAAEDMAKTRWPSESGWLAALQGRPDQAEKMFGTAARRDPSDLEARVWQARVLADLGFTHQLAGRWDEALRMYEQAHQAALEAQTVGRSHEGALMVDLSWRFALEALDEARWPAWVGGDSAREALSLRLLALNPDNVEAISDRLTAMGNQAATALYEGRDPQPILREAIRLGTRRESMGTPCGNIPGDLRELHYLMANYHFASGLDPWPELHEALQRVDFQDTRPRDIRPALFLLIAKVQMGEGKDPSEILGQGEARALAAFTTSHDSEFLANLGRLQLERHRWICKRQIGDGAQLAKAKDTLRRALDQSPDDPWRISYLSEALIEEARWLEAQGMSTSEVLCAGERLLMRIRGRNRSYVAFRILRAECFLQEGKAWRGIGRSQALLAATEEARDVLKVNPRHVRALRVLASVELLRNAR